MRGNLIQNQDLKFVIVTSLLKSIIFFILILFICRISTFDVLKKCKINQTKIGDIQKNMTVFFIICAIFSLMICSLNLSIKYLNFKNDMYLISTDNNNSFKDSNIKIATTLTAIEFQKQKINWNKYKISLCITEISVLLACTYLIPYQKKMILLYNQNK